ncbi:MAG: branched-chain amino acid aminotransferase [Oscillospiraceae bacterium]|jgi:branched-chain amino acid aminotransferase|nr:branched-chain amino acid aminotransferase [Oscillospiraceae bacterium]
MLNIPMQTTTSPKAKPTDETRLGFGKLFTDHMLVMDYDLENGWHDMRIIPYADFSMDPASVVFHYGQAIFEGLKCYRGEGDALRLFRPRDNFVRLNESAARMSIPTIDPDLALEGLYALLRVEKDWVPHSDGASLYIRPTIIATDVGLGVHASHHYRFFIILSPSGAYYAEGLAPVRIYVEDEMVRATRGGIGFTKAAANYAASLMAGEAAQQKGYAQVLWLDGVERAYIEEVGAMNIMFVLDGKIVTPMLTGSILSGITRRSILALAADLGYEVEERRILMQEIFDAAAEGRLNEAFGTGTAAVVSPVGALCWRGQEITVGDGGIGPVAQKLYDTLTGIQRGNVTDAHGWVVQVP